MTIKRSETGDVEVKVSVIRDGVKLQSDDEAFKVWNRMIFIRGLEGIF